MLKKLWAKLRRKDKHNPNPGERPVRKFGGNLDKDEKMIRQLYDKCGDVKYRRMAVPALGGKQVLLVYVEGLSSDSIINRDIVGSVWSSRKQQMQWYPDSA